MKNEKRLKREIKSQQSDFMIEVILRMGKLGVDQSILAQRLNVSAPYISSLLKGEENLTIETMVKIAKALDCELSLTLNSICGDCGNTVCSC